MWWEIIRPAYNINSYIKENPSGEKAFRPSERLSPGGFLYRKKSIAGYPIPFWAHRSNAFPAF
ncbi:hypothetical protein CE91St58_65750 [Lachnospiraceae bacterium]|nr:hypothetical protein CE91St58_65750 [Lachnospiraceae bacterium]